MKMLLTAVNAKYIHSNPAVYSLKAYASQYGDQIGIAEYTINNRTEAILADLYRQAPQAIAFSCYIWNFRQIRELLTELPKILPGTELWLGGPEVSYDAEQLMGEFPQLTGIMVGEGEETFLELMQHYCEGEPALRQIRGLCLRDGMTGARELTNLNRIPFFYECYDNSATSPFANRIIYYESSRGCPYQCSYCLSSIDKTVRFRPIDTVRRELSFFLEKKVPQVKFVDRTFNCNHTHAMEVWRYLLDHDNGVTNFHFEIAADIINEEELNLLHAMRPGLVQLEIGVQSTNPETLREIRRKMDVDRLRYVVERIRQGKNIHIHLDLIAGLPYEDYDSFGRSFDEVYAMKPSQLQLGFLKVLKGSYMYQKAPEYGIIYRSDPPYEVLYSRWLPYDKVLALKRIEEMVELYYNSGQFTHTLAVLEQEYDSPFRMYERLAEYYEEKGYFSNNPSRAYRYEILLRFVSEERPHQEKLYRELLTCDMYLREKCKSRPSFAPELTPYRQALREAEERPDYHKTDHLELFTYRVWEEDAGEMRRACHNPTIVRFSYEKRSPLDHNAALDIVGEV
ncbi:MAG: B12-binding domain-containing radical SAM protein [Lachnospiraceae bacterium]